MLARAEDEPEVVCDPLLCRMAMMSGHRSAGEEARSPVEVKAPLVDGEAVAMWLTKESGRLGIGFREGGCIVGAWGHEVVRQL